MLLNGATLESVLEANGVPRDAAYAFAAVERLVAVITPWQKGAITYIPLTVEQQVEMACSDLIIVPLLCWGPAGAHTHNIALLQRTPPESAA